MNFKRCVLILVIVSVIIGGFFKSSSANDYEGFSILYYSLDDFSKIDIYQKEISMSKLFSSPSYFWIDDAKISKDCRKIVFEFSKINGTLFDSEKEYIPFLWLLDLDKSEFIRLSPKDSNLKKMNFRLTNDESKIIFSVEEDNCSSIYTVNPDGSDLKKITPLYSDANIGWFEISQRNNKLIYSVKDKEKERIFLVNLDGSDLFELPINCRETIFERCLSPDENYLLFSGRVKDKDTLYLVNITKEKVKEIIYQSVFCVSWSGDSSKFAFVVNMGENYGYSDILYSYNLATEKKTLLTPRYSCIENITWYKDNESVYFVACHSDYKSAIRIASFDGKNHHEFVKDYTKIREFKFSPDYEKVAFVGKKSSEYDDEILVTVNIKNPEKEIVLFKCIEFEYFNWFSDSERLVAFAKEEKGKIKKMKFRKESEFYPLFRALSGGDLFEYEDDSKVFSHILLLNCQNFSDTVDKKAEFKYRDIHIVKEYAPLGLIPPKISVKFPSSGRPQKVDFSIIIFMLVVLTLILLVVLSILFYSRRKIKANL